MSPRLRLRGYIIRCAACSCVVCGVLMAGCAAGRCCDHSVGFLLDIDFNKLLLITTDHYLLYICKNILVSFSIDALLFSPHLRISLSGINESPSVVKSTDSPTTA